jgi:hypothetical protein
MRKTFLLIAFIAIFASPDFTIRATEPGRVLLAQTANKTCTVCVKYCPATFTKKDDEELTQYSIHNNTAAINRMILEGRVIVLYEGEKVTLLEKGLFLVKIRTAQGQVVYTSREFIKE